eukprot:CAMPEP_0176503628 /NCGR_PEP_ID=MMETSP0200_2-20121128/15469_1 /TAXON_ID=947934 /ORGANISM="Chaetoceros sp., Strain GSL56" /LENGTH=849 /DNA_ID=CAMNT_0017902941 /DNA_START=1262 /DNA_END=3811 /DNA_ORIENTATION=+
MTSDDMQEAMRILANDYDLPGPFTVLQGTPGDGMANSMDSIPDITRLEYPTSDAEDDVEIDSDGDSALSRDSTTRNDDSDNDGNNEKKKKKKKKKNGKYDLYNHEKSHQPSNWSHHASDDSCLKKKSRKRRQNSDVQEDRGSLGLQYQIELSSDASLKQHVASSSKRDPSNGGHDVSSGVVSPSRTSSGGILSNNNGKSLYMSPPRRDDQPRIGLHLPLPPGLPPIGYNSILPPMDLHLSPRRPQSEEDSFIVIDGEKKSGDDSSSSSNPGSLMSSTSLEDGGRNNIPASITDSSLLDESSSVSSSDHRGRNNGNLSNQHKVSIQEWNRQCREEEVIQMKEVLMHSAAPGIPIERASGASLLYGSQWWKNKRHHLCVFDSPPKFVAATVCGETRNKLELGKTIGELAPGITVMGVEKIAIVNENIHRTSQVSKNLQEGIVEILKIESPFVGYVVYSVDGYPFIGPGLPSNYTDPNVWFWKVTCTRGAFVRQGLELTSVHVATVPFGSFVRVKRKSVNAMGLSRLEIEAILTDEDSSTDIDQSAKSGSFTSALLALSLRKHSGQQSQNQQVIRRKVVGWISEALNPLSGQSGPIVHPIPFPVPALYRVTLPDGAVIRKDIELSSCHIGHAPYDTVLNVVGRAYSQHPMDRCIQRLKLAGGGGWISVKLNRPPPGDHFHVIEQIGIDGGFDPNYAGHFHIEKQLLVLHEFNSSLMASSDENRQNKASVRRSLNRLGSSCISSIHDDDDDVDSNSSKNNAYFTPSSLPALYRSGVADFRRTASQISLKCSSKSRKDDLCLICLTEERNATIVHGETGHIACCLTCARLLKGRGDKCPVCRLPIDLIIQQFWA